MIARSLGKFPLMQIQSSILKVLKAPHSRTWTIEAEGALHTAYGRHCLVLRSRQFQTPGVSKIRSYAAKHTARVVAGSLTVERFTEARIGLRHWQFAFGEMEPRAVNLRATQCDGGSHSLRAGEIHAVHFSDGTVTLETRATKARVFWPIGGDFVTGESRKATVEEIEAACAHARAAWF